jgi:hypothetical protein
VTVAPVLLFAAALVVGLAAAATGVPHFWAVAGALLAVSCLGFVVAPLRALSRARRDE